MSFKLNRYQHRGFTLLEMVLVLFLIGLMASATLLLTEGVEDQAKYDETKHRMEIIRKAIIGDPTRTVNGRPEISGFAADVGRLPICIAELLYLGDEVLPATTPPRFESPCNPDSAFDLSLWTENTDAQIWSGWRGPYIQVISERNGVFYRDGYGNTEQGAVLDAQNSGWNYEENAGVVSLSSNGYDGFGPTHVSDSDDNIEEPRLIVPSDYQVSLGSDWRSVDVQFYSNSAGSFIAEKSLRLKINSPEGGVVLDYASAEMFMSSAFPEGNDLYIPAKTGVIAVDNNHSITFSSDVSLSDDTTVAVPANTEITYANGTGASADSGVFSCSSNCILTTPNSGLTYTLTSGTYTPPATPPSFPVTITKIDFSASGKVMFLPQLITPVSAPNFAKRTITVPAGSVLDKLARKLTLQNGATITFTGDEPDLLGDNVTFDNAQITVSEGVSRTGNTITTNTSADTFSVPSNSVVTGATTIEVPVVSVFNAGVKSFSIVCDLASDPEQGSLFDGDCTDNVDNNLSNPINLTLVPKNTLPLNDEAIEWVIP